MGCMSPRQEWKLVYLETDKKKSSLSHFVYCTVAEGAGADTPVAVVDSCLSYQWMIGCNIEAAPHLLVMSVAGTEAAAGYMKGDAAADRIGLP